MGYTHYWSTSRDIKNVEWQAITAAAKRIISKARNSYMINLAAEFDDLDNGPEIDGDHIRFNGIGEDGHETFYLSRTATDFEFCKTARKDYDAPVVAILIAAKQYAPGAFDWRSDGFGDHCQTGEEYNDHGDGVQLYNEANDANLTTTNASKSS